MGKMPGLAHRSHFEQLLAEISSDFLGTSQSGIEATTERTLQKLGHSMSVDQVLLFSLSEDHSFLDCVHEWSSEGITPVKGFLQRQPRTQFPWLFERLSEGYPLSVSRVSELPDSAAPERGTLQFHGVTSVVWVPQVLGGRAVGALSLSNVHTERQWSEELLAQLTLVANLIASARRRLEAEGELAETRKFLEEVTAASPHMCFIFDLDRQQILHISSQVADLLGYSVSEIFEMGDRILAELVHPDETSAVRGTVGHWQGVGNSDLIESQNRFRHRDGQYCWLRSWVKVFHRAADGHVDQVIGWSEDITERKRAEEELQRHRAELARVDRVNILGEMVTSVAHELSQPLSAVTNFVKAAKNVIDQHQDPTLAEAIEWLKQAGAAATNAGRILQKMRAFARESQLMRGQEKISELVAGAISLVQFDLQRHDVRVEWEAPPDELSVVVDRVQFQQVLVNLLQNASEAMERSHPNDRIIRVEIRRDADRIQFSVRDRGIGLPSNDSQMFKPFFTTKAHGLGLGLAISKTIIEDHGGELGAERNSDIGSTFWFTLPVPQS